jgi:diguanylate cyclase (GGDEF)-like protein/PAS domain S-box-containing protein
VAVDTEDGRLRLDRALTADLELPVAGLTSGNPFYDAELQRRLEVRRFPTAHVALTGVATLDGAERYELRADVTLLDVTCAVAGPATIVFPDERTIVVESEQVFDIRDFGISTPAVPMVRIFPDVRIKLQLVVQCAGAAGDGAAGPAVVTDGEPSPADSILDRCDDAIFGLDRDRRVVSWNRGAARLFGYPREKVLDQDVGMLFPDQAQEQAQALLGDGLSGAAVERVETEGRRQDGLLFPLQVSAVPRVDAGGGIEGVSVIARDITEQRLAQAALATKEERLREAQHLAHVGRWLWDGASATIQWSDELYRMHGMRPMDFDGTLAGYLKLVTPEHRDAVSEALEHGISTGRRFDQEYEIQRPDGRTCWVRTRAEPVTDSSGRILGLQGTCQDLTERRATERAGLMELLRKLTVAANEAPTFQEALGGCLRSVCWHLGASVGHAYLTASAGDALVSARLSHVADGAETAGPAVLTAPATLRPGDGVAGQVLASGEPAWELDLVAALGADRGTAAVAAGIGSTVAVPVLVGQEVVAVLEFLLLGAETPDEDLLDVLASGGSQLGRVVERQRAELALAQQALHDPLTGLANRSLLVDRLSRGLSRLQRDRHQLAVLFLDLDDFKMINDSLGHDIGDAVLVAVADRLRAVARDGDTVARFGGDEFVIVCDELSSEDEAVNIAERVARAVAEPLDLEHQGPSVVTASTGIAIADGSWARPEALLRDADLAMYRAKESGPGSCQIFDTDMHERARQRLDLTSALRSAITREELRLVYQPQVAVSGRSIVGVEALVRWQHPERGLLAPSEFIPLAEDSQLIVPMGAWVIHEACRQASAWRREGVGDRNLKMCVNVSARQLAHPDLISQVRSALRETGLEPARLCVEITESVLMGDVDSLRNLDALKELGLTLAIDDFGTGYSSLAYLHRFPVDVLKVDKSFIDGLGRRDRRARSIVGAVVDIAHSMDQVVVAEGVEEAEQLDELASLGCDVAQGYYFARPVDPETAAEQLQAPASLVSR